MEMNCNPAALKKIMEFIAAYLSEDYGCSYGRLVELFRENIPGLESLAYSDVYPVLMNISAKYPDESLCPHYDCDSAAYHLFHKKKGEKTYVPKANK